MGDHLILASPGDIESGCRATDQMTNFGYFSQAPSVNAGCPYTRPQTCIDRGAAPRVKKPYVSGQAPRRSVAGESFREDADYHSLHSFDAVRTPGVTAHKQGSFQTGFRDAKRPASSPFSSSSTNARGLNHCVGKRPVPLLVGSQIPRPGAKSAKGRPRFKRKVVIGDPMRLTQYKGDNYATQSRESFNGPCNRAQPNNLAPYKLGGGDDLFEEETLKGPIPAGGRGGLDCQRPQTAPRGSSRPNWKGSGDSSKLETVDKYYEDPYKELWKNVHTFKKQDGHASPFIGGSHTKTKGFNGPHGRRNG